MQKISEIQAFLLLSLGKFNKSHLKHYSEDPVIIHYRHHPGRQLQQERYFTKALANNKLQSTEAQYFSFAIFSVTILLIIFSLHSILFIIFNHVLVTSTVCNWRTSIRMIKELEKSNK